MAEDWSAKEQIFETKFNNGTVVTDLWKYIPKKYEAAVSDAFADSEGYWAWLEEGYRAYDLAPDCGQIHEYTIKDFKEAVKTIRRVK